MNPANPVNIVVDAGNTFIKAGAFKDSKLLWSESFLNVSQVISRITEVKPAYVFVSSVRAESDFDALKKICEVIYLSAQTRLPIQINYKNAETLGTDRIAASVGASVLFPNQNNLFFDAGTCLTHGLIDEMNTFQGGSISPGLEMRLKALAHFTAKLPLLTIQEEVFLTGQSTTESIMSGVINGITFEIEGFIRAYQNKYPAMNVLLTGGNALLFEKRLKEPIFVAPELNLIGLNRILTYNV